MENTKLRWNIKYRVTYLRSFLLETRFENVVISVSIWPSYAFISTFHGACRWIRNGELCASER